MVYVLFPDGLAARFGFDWSNVSRQELSSEKDSCRLTVKKYQLFLSNCSYRPDPDGWPSGI
jgi:hypothetical protein